MTARKPAAKKPAKKAPSQYVVANDTFGVGGRVMINKGDVYDAKSKWPKKHPHKFDPVESVENATAVPGQTRKVSIPK
jgi:hypothetical protein